MRLNMHTRYIMQSLTSITYFELSAESCSLKTSCGKLMLFTCPVAKSSMNSAGFIGISGVNLNDEKYCIASFAFP